MDIIIYNDGLYSLHYLDIFFKNVTECVEYGNIVRDKVSTYLEAPDNRWVMNNGMGDWFGFICQSYGAEAP
jgi:hypothetical protein